MKLNRILYHRIKRALKTIGETLRSRRVEGIQGGLGEELEQPREIK